ncbi:MULTISPECIES: hypothetical protein [unclassified Streptomyces]|uniref:hypothetical protein n=1 Tax=unclassified Streptomyces TaxID=2593676 RepID=UPI0004C32BD3
MTDSTAPEPSPEALSELLDADRTRALRALMPPWPAFALSVVCAAAVWVPDEGVARTVAVLSVLAPGAWALLRNGALTREATVYAPDDPEDGPADPVLAARVAARMLVVTNVAVSAVLAAAVLWAPLTWLRVLLALFCLWGAADLFRQAGAARRAREVIARSRREPWYPAYRARIAARRAVLG